MNLNQAILSILLFINLIFNSLTFTIKGSKHTQPVSQTSITCQQEKQNTCLDEIFAKSGIVKNGQVNTKLFFDETVKIDQEFTLPYSDLAYLLESLILTSSTKNIKGEVATVKVNAQDKQATLVFNIIINAGKDSLLSKLAKLKDGILDGCVTFDVDLNDKKYNVSFDSKKINISPVILSIACQYAFNISDYQGYINTVCKRLFEGLGDANEFTKDGIIYNNQNKKDAHLS